MRINTISRKEILFSEEELNVLNQANTILQKVKAELNKEDYLYSVDSNATKPLTDIYFAIVDIDNYMDF